VGSSGEWVGSDLLDHAEVRVHCQVLRQSALEVSRRGVRIARGELEPHALHVEQDVETVRLLEEQPHQRLALGDLARTQRVARAFGVQIPTRSTQ
jgi:hypothetical protein